MNCASTPSGEFARALATFVRTRDEYDALPPTTGDEQETLYGSAFLFSDGKVLHTPAETFLDLRSKAEVLFAVPGAVPNDDDVIAFFRDFHRLTDYAPSPVFNAPVWIERFERAGGGWVVRPDEVFLFGPNGDCIKDLMFVLEMHNGRPVVEAILREREPLTAEA